MSSREEILAEFNELWDKIAAILPTVRPRLLLIQFLSSFISGFMLLSLVLFRPTELGSRQMEISSLSLESPFWGVDNSPLDDGV